MMRSKWRMVLCRASSFRADRAHTFPVPALTEHQLREAMTRLGASSLCAETAGI
jgi:hypothetical protein